MHHLKASNLLTRYLSGDLESGPRKEVEEHLAQCADCAGWAGTYSLFAEALAQHPPSREIARYSLAPETLDPPSYERCKRHLKRCRGCRDEVELVREAAGEARQQGERRRERHPARLRLRWGTAAALAASAVLALGTSLVFRTAGRSPVEVVVADSTLRGEERIFADQSILVETTELAPGAALTLESQVVAFGDGFSIKTGATLVVVTRESANENGRPENSR